MSYRSPGPRPVVDPGDLTLLLETEQRLEGQLQAARAEAAALRAAATQSAERREAEIGASLAAAEEGLAAELQGERRRREAEIAAAARQAVARYEGLDETRMQEVAARLVAKLLEP